jgi:GT2 family glycosyltransferase
LTKPHAQNVGVTGADRARFVAVPTWKVRAVVPCHNRATDVHRLLSDLAVVAVQAERVGLTVLVVDNASAEPVSGLEGPEGLDVRFLRLETNRGGSGGFNAGMEAWLGVGVPGDVRELIWLLDSDARVEAGALEALVQALERHPELAGVGSALVDPENGQVFEVGGEVDPHTGELVQELPRDWVNREVIPAGYVAACSLLVRRTVIETAGVMADLFLSGDDVEWCYRVRAKTGLGFGVAVASRVIHPNPDKMRTVGRYYAARNAFTAMSAAGVVGRRVRFRRGMREVGRAVAQVLVGRDDLAALHLNGLRDAGKGGPAPEASVAFEAFQPLSELDGAIKLALRGVRGKMMLQRGVLADPAPLLKSLNAVCVAPEVVAPGAARRGWLSLAGAVLSKLLRPPAHGVAVVSARARPDDWLAGRVIVSVAAGGFCTRRVGRLDTGVKAVRAAARGTWFAARQALAAVPAAREHPAHAVPRGIAPLRPTLSIVILTHNRWGALERTLTTLLSRDETSGAEIIVVDSASTDGTPAKAAAKFPDIRVLALKHNAGVGGFNEGVRVSTGEVVLILDDDAWPGPGVLERALELLTERPDIAAVSLHPCHPASQESEWRFLEGRAIAGDLRERWPLMGCGNLVRRTAWDRVGGYEESFFLYRNDVDLALKLIGSGHCVYFESSWVVWHDSAAAGGRKPLRWFELASRNWVWLCRRHGRGWRRWKAMVAGLLWAHRLAAWSPAAHAAVVRGGVAGLVSRRPKLPRACGGRGVLEQFMRARLAGGRVKGNRT